jgi:putative ABC transport system permease protein
MSIIVIFRVALKALARNKMRTVLTMLGMIIGVAAVITMVALGNGAQQQIEEQVRSAGTNLITVRAGNYRRGGISMGMGGAPTLKAADVDAIREQVPGAVYLAASVNTRDQVIAAGQNWSAQIEGTDIEFPMIRFWDLEYGSFFTETHVRSAAKVAVLGTVVRDNLFGEGADPVGQRVRIRNQSFQIIGVMEAKGSGQFGQDQDDTILVPYTTVQKKLRGRDGTNISGMTISAASADEMEAITAEISTVLRAQHRLIPGDDDDFMIRTQEDMASMRTGMTETMTGLLAAIAGVSLVVGGIGIMNIMLVSVTERTREIGLRMAVGAKGRDVLMQFLVEAIVLSLVGGLIGVALGFGLSEGLTRVLQWPTSVPPNAVGVAVGFAAATGIFFGFYPARQAARLDPIESLRFE